MPLAQSIACRPSARLENLSTSSLTSARERRTPPSPQGASRLRDFFYLGLLTIAALLVHGYHLGTEDQAIYLPAIKQLLDPALYPHDAEFFLAQTRPTLFPQLIAASARWTHAPLDAVVFAWQLLSIFLVLWGCLRLARKFFASARAQWSAVAMITVLLTLPVAGTALFLVDPYLHPRTLATAALLFMLADVLDRKLVRAVLWLALAALLHIQMAFYGALLALFLFLPKLPQAARLALFFPLGALFEPATPAWQEAARTRWYHYLLRWPWHAWVGIFAPLALLWGMSRFAEKKGLPLLARVAWRLAFFGVFIFAASALLTVPPALERFTPYQPMRGYHLLYLLLMLFIGGLLGEFVLKQHVVRWLALFLPLSLLMFYVQRQTLPASPHIELPGARPHNPWLEAFAWIEQNTPTSAYFALDPHYVERPGEDVHGFRAFAERSMMADYVKDSGVALLFPAIAARWQHEVHARDNWQHFTAVDFHRLRESFGVDWAVIEDSHPAVSQLDCPYSNDLVRVCRIP